MTYGVYAMRDVKVGFMTPTFDVNDESAKRNFIHAVLTSDSILSSFANDFSLYRLGDYDTETGQLLPLSLPLHLFDASAALLTAVKSSGGDV